ncbi:MAG: hypothetical protein Q8P82_02840 [bacterium]|nr:hypothetical protein [bacterium]
MRFLFRFIPHLLGIAAAGSLLAVHFSPERWWLWGVGFSICMSYGLFVFFGGTLRSRDFWNAYLLMLLFYWATFSFFLYFENTWERIAFAVFIGSLVGIFMEQLYRWFYGDRNVPSYSLTVNIAILEILTVCTGAASFLGFRMFLRLPVWALTIVFGALAVVLYIIARGSRQSIRSLVLPAMVVGLFFGELMLAVIFLPTGFMIGGAFIGVVWYLLVGLLRASETGVSLRKPMIRYTAFASALVVLLAVTARWL